MQPSHSQQQPFISCGQLSNRSLLWKNMFHENQHKEYEQQKDSGTTSRPRISQHLRGTVSWQYGRCCIASTKKTMALIKVTIKCDQFLTTFRINLHGFCIPECEPSFDEGKKPTKSSFSFKQYIRLKPNKWRMQCVLLCESKTVNDKVYNGETTTTRYYCNALV